MSAATEVAALPRPMTTAEFLDYPDDPYGRRQQLVDGELITMSPVSDAHSLIHAELAYLLSSHLRATRPSCRVLITPGVPPRFRPEWNVRSPDLAVVCGASEGSPLVHNPVVLVEILSPSNQRETRANVWAYTTIPTAQEILLVSSIRIGGELLRRDAGGSWPERATLLGIDDTVRLDSIGAVFALRDLYVATALGQTAP